MMLEERHATVRVDVDQVQQDQGRAGVWKQRALVDDDVDDAFGTREIQAAHQAFRCAIFGYRAQAATARVAQADLVAQTSRAVWIAPVETTLDVAVEIEAVRAQ